MKTFSIIVRYLFLTLICFGIVGVRIYQEYKKNAYYYLDGAISYETIDVGAYTGGNIKNVFAKEGDIVDSGFILMELENDVLSERFDGMDPKSVNFSKPDYLELKEKLEKLNVRTPSKVYVAKLNTNRGAFIRDNDIVATLIPVDSIKYTATISQKDMDDYGLDFKEKTNIGNRVEITYSDHYSEFGSIERFTPYFDKNNQIDKTLTTMYIQPENVGAITFGIIPTLTVRIVRDNSFRAVINRMIQNLKF